MYKMVIPRLNSKIVLKFNNKGELLNFLNKNWYFGDLYSVDYIRPSKRKGINEFGWLRKRKNGKLDVKFPSVIKKGRKRIIIGYEERIK